jgi:hypothetical protein
MAAKGTLPVTLKALRNELDARPVEPAVDVRAGGA